VPFCCCIVASEFTIATNTTADCGTFQMAHDAKIYIAFNSSFYLVINNQNLAALPAIILCRAKSLWPNSSYLDFRILFQVILLTHRQRSFYHTVSNISAAKQLHSLPLQTPLPAQ